MAGKGTILVFRSEYSRTTVLIPKFKYSFLVIFFFMGVKWDEGFNKVILFGSLVFIALFMVFVMLDVFTRDDIYSNESDVHSIKSPVRVVEEYSEHH